jgi:hypothetical protein
MRIAESVATPMLDFRFVPGAPCVGLLVGQESLAASQPVTDEVCRPA